MAENDHFRAKCCFMNRIWVYGIFRLLISCTAQERSRQTADTLMASTPIQARDSVVSIEATSSTEEENDDDCIFNNDFKGLTTDWLKELKITEFIWRDNLSKRLFQKDKTRFFSNRVVVPIQGLWLS